MSPVRMGSPLIGPGGAVEFEWADIQARLVVRMLGYDDWNSR